MMRLADDVADHRTMLKLVLEQSGRFEVVAEAADAGTAVELAALHLPDLAILDLQMPGLALDAVGEIRWRAPLCKVVVWSGFLSDATRAQARAEGADTVLDKAGGSHELIEELLSVVGG